MIHPHVYDDVGGAGARAPATVDGLRAYLRRVYNYMAGGLALTGAVAYFGATSGFYTSIASTPLFWVVLLPRWHSCCSLAFASSA